MEQIWKEGEGSGRKYRNFQLQTFCWKNRRRYLQRIQESCSQRVKSLKTAEKVITGNQQNGEGK